MKHSYNTGVEYADHISLATTCVNGGSIIFSEMYLLSKGQILTKI